MYFFIYLCFELVASGFYLFIFHIWKGLKLFERKSKEEKKSADHKFRVRGPFFLLSCRSADSSFPTLWIVCAARYPTTCNSATRTSTATNRANTLAALSSKKWPISVETAASFGTCGGPSHYVVRSPDVWGVIANFANILTANACPCGCRCTSLSSRLGLWGAGPAVYSQLLSSKPQTAQSRSDQLVCLPKRWWPSQSMMSLPTVQLHVSLYVTQHI